MKMKNNYTLTPSDFLSREERSRLMNFCSGESLKDLRHGRERWVKRYMLVDLALYSGLRVGEIRDLCHRDIRLSPKDSYLIVRKGKGGKRRVVYIDQGLSDHLREYIDWKKKSKGESVEDESPLFPRNNGLPSPTITFMKSFKRCLEDAGLRGDLSIHSCRHTYATFLLHDTGNLRYVQRQLGHTNIGMTSLYADILPEENGHLANMIKRDENGN